ncbi:carbohydrate ABC transporter permease [Natrialba asiatica]|uniref:Binding-protein-dependent transporters inner membrane component n=1 Tax=Natrialba asiatica (strain ATCC 700177 / DSM 12278 / JCM 9576 / FERM P-10747 / NBRC 102637 / 172P1) TaxID=29540 RepID=M0AKP6_NATA1|nr:sugar ABC transporter permease [Natrialba asiatica]ELY99295.1 binding-protein-dependent transporters inner membrane component [Natrialba asiatica DSM 12278]
MASETVESTATTDRRSVRGRLGLDGEALRGWATVAPVILLYLFVAVTPVAFAIYASLFEVPLLNPNWTFTGLSNYVEVLTMNSFWSSLWLGALFMIGSTVVQLLVGLWIALVLNQLDRGQRFLTAVAFTAYLVPTVIVVLVALFMFDVEVGVLHIAGSTLGLWGERTFALGDQTWAMPLVVLVGSWKFSIFVTIFTLAQLRAIPDRFYEAAKICGASRWEMFRDITLPRITGVLLIAVLLRAVFMFNKFDIIWMLTEGGPAGATTTLPILAYRTAFLHNDYGVANAMAVVMFVFLAIGAYCYFRAFDPTAEVNT